jgi:hypothetical protein
MSQPAVWAERLLLLAATLAALASLGTVSLNDNSGSRLASAWSLTHAGTWYIDVPADGIGNPFAAITVDKVAIGDHVLSTKPPLLPLGMAAAYAAAFHLTGYRLDQPEHLKLLVQYLILLFAILPYLLLLFFFARSLALLTPAPWPRIYLLFGLAFATQALGFAAEINNHIPGAAALMAFLYGYLGLVSGQRAPHPARFAATGLAGGLVFTLDMPLTIFVALAGLHLLYRFPRQAVLWTGVGMALPLVVHFGLMLQSSGSVLPIQMRKELYVSEGAYWRQPGGLDGLHEPKGTYAFHMLFGRHGTFLLFPILLLGLLAPAMPMPPRAATWRPYQWGGLLAFAVLTAYYILRTNNYGGAAYGFRWHLGSMPVILLAAAPWCGAWKRPVAWCFAAALLLVSLYSALECWRTPWGSDNEWTVRLLFGPSF